MRPRHPLFALALLFSATVHAQSNATLIGTLTDPSGGAIAAAKISAEPLPSGATIETISNAQGRFTLTLAPGRYRVSITHASFAHVEEEITLAGNESREWNVRMELEKLASTVIVTAEAEPTPATATTAPVTVLTRQEITQRQEIWLAPLLSSAGGINLTRLGPLGGITTLFLDGGNSNFTKVLVDGTPVNQPGGDVDFSNFTLDNVEKIEIVHGASSALFGSDAMAGVVQIFTRRGTTRIPQLMLLGEGGSFGTGRGLAQLSGLAGAFDYSGSASYFDSSGQGANDRFRQSAFTGNFGWRFTDTDNVRLTLRNTTSDAGEPGQTLLEPPILDQHTGLHDFSANLGLDFTTGPRWHHQLSGAEDYVRQTIVTPFGNDLNRYNRAGFEEQSSYVFGPGGLSLGYQYEVENGAPNGPHVRRNNQAGYGELRFHFRRRWNFNFGARGEDNASFGTRGVFRGGLAVVLRYGHNFWGAMRLRLSGGQGIKEPTLVQSFEKDPCFPGNPRLKPEQSLTGNVGIEQLLASDRVRLSIDYFYNHYGDIVSFSFGPATPSCKGGTGTFFNTDAARAFGSHFSLEARPTHWLHFVGNYMYDDTRVLKAPNAFDPTLAPGQRLIRRPLHSANLIANANFRRMNWNLATYYVGRRTDSDFLGLGITSNPSYVRVDLATSYDWGHGFATIGRVENLFNRHYQDAIGYPALRLNFRAGMRYAWGGE